MPRRQLQTESLEARQLLAADVVISEFMASNDNGIRDEDHNRPDWIEILNQGDETISLNGWFLTDDASDLDKWEIPQLQLSPNERQIIFASEKNRRDPNGELHTNFALNQLTDYLALVQPDGLTVAFDYEPAYPAQLPDVSFGIPQQVTNSTIIDTDSSVRAFVPTSTNGGANLGQTWTDVDFDDASWLAGNGAVGYETTEGYEDLIKTDLLASMFDVNGSVFLRYAFDLADSNSVFSLTLSAQYDDGYVAFINGQEIAGRNAPEELAWNSDATDARRDPQAVVPEEVVVDALQFEQLLRTGKNVLAVQAMNNGKGSNDFLFVPTLEARSFGELEVDQRNFFANPTPGEPNDLGSATSIISVSHAPSIPAATNTVTVTAETITTDAASPTSVTLHYRVMYDDETSVEMYDDGQHNDLLAGDGIYAAEIPAGIAAKGQMVRYRITTSSDASDDARRPTFADGLDSEQYFGLVIESDSVQSNLPVIHVFVEDPAAADTIGGTTGSLFYNGKFYDNIEIDTTGRTVGLSGPKKSHDIFFTSDHWFEFEDDGATLRMNDFDIISDFWNRSKLRVPLAYETFTKIGSPSHLSLPVRVEQNGEFFGTFSFVDGGNEQFLARAGLDRNGALYKMNLGFSQATGVSKKQTRTHEDNTDLREFFVGMNLEGEERIRFIMDNVNIPATVNYLVGLVIVAAGDCCNKNLYIYRDTAGTGEWEPLPWDMDSAFGRAGVGLAQSFFTASGGLFTGSDNVLFKTLFNEVPGFRDMYLRRLRTLMDEYVQIPGTPEEELYFENRIDEMARNLAPDVPLDFDKWGSWITDPATEVITMSKEGVPSWDEELSLLRNDYMTARRSFLYNGLRSANGGDELPPQVAPPMIQFGQIEFNPASGNQDEEYIELNNENEVAVDISGWQLTGGVSMTFRPGTVIPAGGTLYVSPNVNAFRARTEGPSRGQGLFVTGAYAGHISNHGTTLQLLADDDTIVNQAIIAADLTPEQRFLRVSEVMYHPRAPGAGSRFDQDDYEFVELVNISASETINLRNVMISEAIEFSFPDMELKPGERTVVVRDQTAFIERYGAETSIAGEYGRTASQSKLGNNSEIISLAIAAGDLIQEFKYDDDWVRTTDGDGFSLTVVDTNGELSRWNEQNGWRASQSVDGSPGIADDSVFGDLNSDGIVNVADVDLLCSGIHENAVQFDLNEDAIVDQADFDLMIQGILGTNFGDANLDGVFNSTDLVSVFQAGEFEDGIAGNSTWAEGDWDCDGNFGTGDLVVAFQTGEYLAAAVGIHSKIAAALDQRNPL